MGSHSVIGHQTQLNTPHLNHSPTGQYLIYPPQRDGRLSWPNLILAHQISIQTEDKQIFVHIMSSISRNSIMRKLQW